MFDISRYSTLIFDLDGTLIDPRVGFCRSVNFALAQVGRPFVADAKLLPFIGPPIEKTFAALLDTDDSELVERAVAKYRLRYARSGYLEVALYPDIVAMLNILKNAGVRLGVCTSKRREITENILAQQKLRHFFRFVSGGDRAPHKGRQLKDLLDTGVIDHNAIMIGDRAVDLIAASENNLAAAGVSWGYGSREELMAEIPHYLFGTPLDLARQFETRVSHG